MKPRIVLIKSGGKAKTIKAISAGSIPVPINGISKKSKAKLGIIRNTWANAVQKVATGFIREPIYPNGNAITIAIANVIKLR